MTSHSRRILLIVEDDPQLRELLQHAAERTEKFSLVEVASDGQAALDQVVWTVEHRPERAPDFILTDLSMPHLDGLELIRALKGRPETREIPIAVMTSSNRPNDRSDATAAGCCAFFNKPVAFDDMVTFIGSLPSICGDDAPVGGHVTAT